jgi:hypothetical protein
MLERLTLDELAASWQKSTANFICQSDCVLNFQQGWQVSLKTAYAFTVISVVRTFVSLQMGASLFWIGL